MPYQKVDHSERLCRWCSALYKPTTSHQNFCGKGCYRKWGKKYKGHSDGTPESRKLRGVRPHRRNVPLLCSMCGFTAQHKCQIDLDHIDGNHHNNAADNLQYICANCHRLKTLMNCDYVK